MYIYMSLYVLLTVPSATAAACAVANTSGSCQSAAGPLRRHLNRTSALADGWQHIRQDTNKAGVTVEGQESLVAYLGNFHGRAVLWRIRQAADSIDDRPSY